MITIKSTRSAATAICAAGAFAIALPVASLAETVQAEPDAYLEYIEATGTQYIDTGVNAATGLLARIDMAWADGGTSCDWGFLGAKDGTLADDKSRIFLYHGNYNSGAFKLAYGYGKFARPANGAAYETRHEIVSDFSDYTALQIYLNGGPKISAADQSTRAGYGPLNLGLNLFLFAINLKDSSHPAGAPANFGRGRLYELKIFRKDAATGELELLRHYLPCLKDGKAGLYDKKNGTISFSDGISDFVPGNVLTPPAALVEWVSTDGTTDQAINTWTIGKVGLSSQVDVAPLTVGTSSSGDYAILASRSSGTGNGRYYMAYIYKLKFDFGRGTLASSAGILNTVTPVAGTRYLISANLTTNTQSVTVNGTELSTAPSATCDYFSTGTNLYLFANNHFGASVKNPSKVRFYSAKIWDGDELLRDFVPCVATNGVAGLYDTVSERVFFPEKTAFDPATHVGVVTNVLVEGAKPSTRIGYVEADGAADFVNLGVDTRDGIKIDAEMEFETVPSDNTFAGARGATNNDKFYLLQYSSNRGFHFGYVGSLPDVSSKVDAVAGVRYSVTAQLDAGSQKLNVSHRENGSVENDCNLSRSWSGPSNVEVPIYLFARNNNGTADLFTNVRVYRLKLSAKQQDGSYVLVRNLVPVNDPVTGGAALWDEVTETYFRNGGKYRLVGGGEEQPMNVGMAILVR